MESRAESGPCPGPRNCGQLDPIMLQWSIPQAGNGGRLLCYAAEDTMRPLGAWAKPTGNVSCRSHVRQHTAIKSIQVTFREHRLFSVVSIVSIRQSQGNNTLKKKKGVQQEGIALQTIAHPCNKHLVNNINDVFEEYLM